MMLLFTPSHSITHSTTHVLTRASSHCAFYKAILQVFHVAAMSLFILVQFDRYRTVSWVWEREC